MGLRFEQGACASQVTAAGNAGVAAVCLCVQRCVHIFEALVAMRIWGLPRHLRGWWLSRVQAYYLVGDADART